MYHDLLVMEIGTLGQWASAIATFTAAFVALFKEEIVKLWRRPKLIGSITLHAPDCEKTEIQVTAGQNPQMVFTGTNNEGVVAFTGSLIPNAEIWRGHAFFFRLWIENQGQQRADEVQVFAKHLKLKHADGIFRTVETFMPMNLRWTHNPAHRPAIFADINPFMGRHCDLGSISDPSNPTQPLLLGLDKEQVSLDLALEVFPYTQSHRLIPGCYQLELRIAAANAKPIVKVIEITFTGRWYSDVSDMFKSGIGIREID
jgi:hypothetical protein